MEENRIDVRGEDYSWFEGVKVYVDYANDRFLFPEESIDRLGLETEPDGKHYLMDGSVEAEEDRIPVGGQEILVWSVGVNQLVIRPSPRNRPG